jgi:hypothetical protein
MNDPQELLADYARRGAEPAFTELVGKYLNFRLFNRAAIDRRRSVSGRGRYPGGFCGFGPRGAQDLSEGIVLPENWTGGLDGESEETIIPSREIYETTT